MTVDSLDTVFYMLAFVVPGFVCNWIYSMFVPRKTTEKVQVTFVRWFTVSCLNYALWCWLIYLILNVSFFASYPLITAVLWALIIFVSPAAIGLLAVLAVQTAVVREWVQKLGLRPMHPIPTAWDYVFGKLEGCHWIVVTLRDGTKVRGVYAPGSFASSESEERDLYLEKVFRRGDDGTWEPVERSAGMLICRDEIKHVEFIAD